MTTSKKLASTGLAVALGAGALASVSLAGPANAASTTTAGWKGSPANHIAVVDYGPVANVTLTAIQNVSDIDVAVAVSQGSNNGPVSEAAAGSYRFDAFVRLGGVADTRGTRLIGTPGTVAVPADAPYPGFTVNGKFANVGAGTFSLTLTDLLLDSNGDSSGGPGFGSAPDGSDAKGFDVWLNKNTTSKAITRDENPAAAGYQNGPGMAEYKEIGLKESVTLVGVAVGDRVGPKLKAGKLPKKAKKVKAVKGTAKDATGTQSVTVNVAQKVKGKGWLSFNGKKWKKAKSKKKALKKSIDLIDSSVTTKWKVKVKKVQPGKLVVQYAGADTLGNIAKAKKKTYKLK